ncbi:hypothetical protein GQ607_017510 [Colletotrichum asianum]|uniref:Uncharacterized protein n=1 Tax=Colletotrichum asianum TaxID=702518 RepID=A0A8H3ZD88_9PEZI|nr:hypothetical protein GQ607_017510 [Colletotrichum asianum]
MDRSARLPPPNTDGPLPSNVRRRCQRARQRQLRSQSHIAHSTTRYTLTPHHRPLDTDRHRRIITPRPDPTSTSRHLRPSTHRANDQAQRPACPTWPCAHRILSPLAFGTPSSSAPRSHQAGTGHWAARPSKFHHNLHQLLSTPLQSSPDRAGGQPSVARGASLNNLTVCSLTHL